MQIITEHFSSSPNTKKNSQKQYVFLSQYSKRHHVRCPWGYFLSGLYRNENQTLSDVDCGYCCKPKNYPTSHARCYPGVADDMEKRITKPGWLGCKVDGYYATGFIRGNHTDSLGTLHWLNCCQMFTGTLTLRNLNFPWFFKVVMLYVMNTGVGCTKGR